jgi:hypothetical protein
MGIQDTMRPRLASVCSSINDDDLIMEISLIYLCIYIWPGQQSRYKDWLRAERSGDRSLVGARFFAHVQTDPGAHPASCIMGTLSFPGVKRLGRGADHPPLLAPRSRKSRAIPLPSSGPSGLLRGTFTFYSFIFYLAVCVEVSHVVYCYCCVFRPNLCCLFQFLLRVLYVPPVYSTL